MMSCLLFKSSIDIGNDLGGEKHRMLQLSSTTTDRKRPNDFIFAFFHGEEKGCIGSSYFVMTDDFYNIIENVSKKIHHSCSVK